VRYQLDINNIAHKWYYAASGSGGITWTQAMTLDASGNLGVGATSITGVSGYQIFETRGSTGGIYQTSASGNSVRARFYSTSEGGFAGTPTNHPFAFITNDTERARITSGGWFKASNTGAYQLETGTYHELRSSANDTQLATFSHTAASPFGIIVRYTAASPNNTDNWFIYCDDSGGTQRFSARANGGIYNYQANDLNLSDLREKTNFAPAKSYLDTICAIPVQTFNYIDQSEDDPGLTLGVVAQDVQAVAPELVMESNWGTKDDPKMRLSIYQTDLQYALMKCIQELKAQNDDLRARVAQLEAK
jgi:hypothetical protein